MAAPWEEQEVETPPWGAPAPAARAKVETAPWGGAPTEPEAPPWGQVIRSLPEQFGAGLESTSVHLRLMRARENFYQREDLSPAGFSGTPAGAATGLVQPSTVQRQQGLQEQGLQESLALRKQAEEATALQELVTPKNMSFGQQVVSSLAQSAAPTLAGLAIGIVTKNPLLAMTVAGGGGAALQGGATYQEALSKGASHEQAARASGIDAVLEGVGEALPLGYALKEGTPIFKRIFGTIAAEAGQEGATQAMQDLHAFLSYNPDITLQEAWQNLKLATASGALMGGVVGGAAHVADASREPRVELRGPSGEVIDTKRLQDIVNNKDPKYQNLDEPAPIPTKAPAEELAAVLPEVPLEPTPEQVAAARAGIAAEATRRSETPKNPDTMLALAGLNELNAAGDLGEISETQRQTANARNYPNINDLDPRTDRPVTYGPEEAVGLALAQVQLHPGVYTIGVPTEDRDDRLLRGLHDTLDAWRQEILPGATILLMNEGLPTDTATGWHSRLESGVHVITPAVLRKMRTSATFNTNAQFDVFTNLSHEFGHAIILEKFFEGASGRLAAQVRAQAKKGVVDEELIAQLPEAIQAVVQEFNAIKQEILNGTMSAQEFRLRWMNPAKIHIYSMASKRRIPDSAPATQLIDAFIREAYKGSQTLTSAQKFQLRNEYLGLDEYLAEQTARHAYTRRWEAAPTLQSLIGRALESARNSLTSFFKMLKREDVIAPGVKFSEWLDTLTKNSVSKVKPGKKALPKAKPRVKLKAAPAEPLADPQGRIEPKGDLPELDHNAETRDEERAKQARGMIVGLVRDGAIEMGDSTYKELQALVKAADWLTLADTLGGLINKKVRFEIDGDVPAESHAALPSKEPADVARDAKEEWRLKGFRSKYFKAWFGDWENSPSEASRVVTAEGEPLVVYHATPFTFEQFQPFSHFGTVQVANTHMLQSMQYVGRAPGEQELEAGFAKGAERLAENIRLEPWSIMPVVLNIRNPLLLEGEGFTWYDPLDLADELAGGPITAEQAIEVINAPQIPGDPFRALRDVLERNGYDGIKYQNNYQGDTSWVTFRPEQVKSVLGTKQFGRSPKIHFELDFDEATTAGNEAGKLWRKFKGLVPNPPVFRRLLKFAAGLQYNVLQVQQVAHLNPRDSAFEFMARSNSNYERDKAALQAAGNDLADRWQGGYPVVQPRHLNKEQAGWLNKFLQAEMDSGELWVQLSNVSTNPRVPEWRFEPSEIMRQKLKELGIETDTPRGRQTAEMILEVKNSLLHHVNEAEMILTELLARRHSGPALGYHTTILRDSIKEIRRRPFMPRGHFGEYMLTIERKREGGRGWEKVHREAFEDGKERDRRAAQMEQRALPNERIRRHTVREQLYVMMTLPEDFLDLAASELGITAQSDLQTLHDIALPVRTEKALKAYDRKRLGITGGSQDGLRSYSNFIWHNANLLSKLHYRAQFNLAVATKRSELRRAEYAPVSPESSKLEQRLSLQLRMLERMRDQVLDPAREWHMLRSWVALSFLALNVKTALLNPFTLGFTASHLTSELGTVEGGKAFTLAAARSMRSINPFDLSARLKGDYLPPEIQRGLDRAIREGQLSQSYSYYLAGVANTSNMNRMPGRYLVGRAGRDAIDLAMWLFRFTELATRRVTFLSVMDANLKKGLNEELAYQDAVRTTALLQGDYSAGARPHWLGAGTKLGPVLPLATVFATFTQLAAFHTFGGYEIGLRRAGKHRKAQASYTLKIMLLLLLMAGYEGLPGMENILDIMDAIWKKLYGEPVRKRLRENIRDLLKQAFDWDTNPSSLAHGLGHNTNFFGLTGEDRFDVSRSVGFGRFFPGTDVLAKSGRPDVPYTAGELVFNLFGPTGAIARFIFETLANPEKGMKRAPGALGNYYNAYKWSEEGLLAPDGAVISRDLQTGELRDLTAGEILGKSQGFNPTIVSENRERIFTQYDAKMYWSLRRSGLLEDMWKARLKDDREAIADVREAIQEFNEEVEGKELRSLRITPKELAASYKQRMRSKRETERGLPHGKRYRGLYESITRSFEGPDAEGSPQP